MWIPLCGQMARGLWTSTSCCIACSLGPRNSGAADYVRPDDLVDSGPALFALPAAWDAATAELETCAAKWLADCGPAHVLLPAALALLLLRNSGAAANVLDTGPANFALPAAFDAATAELGTRSCGFKQCGQMARGLWTRSCRIAFWTGPARLGFVLHAAFGADAVSELMCTSTLCRACSLCRCHCGAWNSRAAACVQPGSLLHCEPAAAAIWWARARLSVATLLACCAWTGCSHVAAVAAAFPAAFVAN